MPCPRFSIRTLIIAVACLAVSMAGVGAGLRANDRLLERDGESRATRVAVVIGLGVPAVVVIAISIGAVTASVFMIPKQIATLRANLRRRAFEQFRYATPRTGRRQRPPSDCDSRRGAE